MKLIRVFTKCLFLIAYTSQGAVLNAKITRFLDVGGKESVILSCASRTDKVRCTAQAEENGIPSRSRSIEPAKAENIVKAFFSELPEEPGSKDSKGGTLLQWEAKLGDKTSWGVIAKDEVALGKDRHLNPLLKLESRIRRMIED